MLQTLLDGIARQSEIESSQGDVNGAAKDVLIQLFQAYRFYCTMIRASLYPTRYKQDPRLPKFFEEACRIPRLCVAIDRELLAFRLRQV